MQHKHYHSWLPMLAIAGICIAYFYKFFFQGLLPFPGDILLSEYKPWQSYSFNGYTPGSIPNKAQYFDTVRQIYPWHELTSEIWKSGNIPLWNPYNFSGSPLLANSQSAALYPLRLIYLILPTTLAWTLLVLSQPALAILFTYIFLRSAAISRTSALFGGVAYGLSLFMSVFLEYNTIGHVLLWLPLALTAINSLKKRYTIRWSIVYVLALFMSGTAGHLQIFAVSLVATIAYGFLAFRNVRIRLLHYVILTAIGLGILSAQLIPTFSLLAQSARVNQPYTFMIENLLIQPKQIFMLFSPDIFGNPATRNYTDPGSYPGKALYVGLLCLFFVHVALRNRKHNGHTAFFIWLSVIIAALVIRTPLSEWLYRFSLPFISTSSPANMLFLLSFALAVLGAFGLESWTERTKTTPIYSLILFASILGILLIMGSTGNIVIVQSMLKYSALLLVLLSFMVLILPRFFKQRMIIAVCILFIQTVDLWYFGQKFNPFVPVSYIYPPTPVISWLQSQPGYNRFWGYGTAGIEANFSTIFRLYSAEGYDPLYPKEYGELVAASKNGLLLREFDTATRSDARITPGFGNSDIAENQFRLKLLALTGTAYILDRVENGTDQTSFPPEQFTQVFDQDGWRIYTYTRSMSRVHLVSEIQQYRNKAEFEQLFFDEQHNPVVTALVEQHTPQGLDPLQPTDSAHITAYTPNKIDIQTKNSGTAFLVLSDTFDPGWKASIDGNAVPIYKTNYAFRGIYVPSGEHQIQFAYKPDSFYLGIKLSMISVLAFLGYGFMLTRKLHHA